MPDTSDSTSIPPTSETYTLGYSGATIRALQQRTLAICASFFLPYLHPGMTVLDCGCGPGTLTLEIARRVAPGQVVGIDVDPGQCAQAQALAAAQGVANIRFEPADVYALPYPAATFDAVFSHALISHLAEPMRAFAECRRVLNPDGVLAVSVNDYDAVAVSPAGSAMDRMFAFYPRVVAHNGGNRLLARHLRGAVLEAGFARVDGYAGAEVYGTPETVRILAADMAEVARGPDFVETVLDEGWADQAEMAALPDELLRWGDRPDAYMAVLKCGVLGWVNHR
jgi:ubiquinone/menaquinone biosynthesis C-methylase UbiE